jgi:hypothetical protein
VSQENSVTGKKCYRNIVLLEESVTGTQC